MKKVSVPEGILVFETDDEEEEAMDNSDLQEKSHGFSVQTQDT